VTTDPQITESINLLATTISQIAGQLQQIGLQLNQLSQQVASTGEAAATAVVPSVMPSAASEPQLDLVKRFSSLEDLVQQLSIRVGALERREVAFTASLLDVAIEPAEPNAEPDLDDDTDDEPDEVLWDFIDPVAPGSTPKPG